MMNGRELRTIDDLDRALRSVSRHFKQDAIIVVGSQAILVGWETPPKIMRKSDEIDLYPAIEKSDDDHENSETINALFGFGSDFHDTFGFYIDGVDSSTARLPANWQERAVFREVEDYGSTVTAIAPSIEDLVVSKLFRLEDKDKDYIKACHQAWSLDIKLINARFEQIGPSGIMKERAQSFLSSLPKQRPAKKPKVSIDIPDYERPSHQAFLAKDGVSVIIREWDEERSVYYKIGNDRGPAIVSEEKISYLISGDRMSREEWEQHPHVRSALSNIEKHSL